MASRFMRGLEIRDAGVKLVTALGRPDAPPGGESMLVYKNASLTVIHRTPPQVPSISADEYFDKVEKHGLPWRRMACCWLDIWRDGEEVLNVEWIGDERNYVGTFRRGEWEKNVLSIARGLQDGHLIPGR